MRRSMLAPQNLSRGRDYRTHYSLGHPEACRSPTWELQVIREGAGGSKCGGAGELSRKWIDLRGAEGERVRVYQGEKAPVFICLI